MGYLDWEGDGTRDKEKLAEMSRAAEEKWAAQKEEERRQERVSLDTVVSRRQEEAKKRKNGNQKNQPGIYNWDGSSGNKGGNLEMPKTYNPEYTGNSGSQNEQYNTPATSKVTTPKTTTPKTPAEVTPATTPVYDTGTETTKPADTQTGPRYTDTTNNKPAETESIVYTPKTTTGNDTTKKTAAGTKDAMTGNTAADDYLAAWQRRQADIDTRRREADLAEANAEDRRRRQAEATANYLANNPQYMGIYSGTTTEGADRLIFGSVGNAAREDTARRLAEQFTRDYGAGRRAGYEYVPPTPAITPNPYTVPGTPVTPQQASEPGRSNPSPTVQGEPTVEALAKQYNIPVTVLDNPDFRQVYDNLKAQGQTNASALSNAYARFAGKQADATNKQVNDRVKEIEAGMENVSKEEHDAIKKQVQDAMGFVNDYGASKREGYEYVPPRTSTAGTSPAATTPETGNNRPGADAEVNSWDGTTTGSSQNMPGMGRPNNDTYQVTDTTQLSGTTNGGTNNGTNTGTNTGTNNGTTTGTTNGNVPKGSVTFEPSYGQGGTGVKAPYKTGGYTEEELIAMGNNNYGKDKYGNSAYEGYYKWNGKYYPVDQEKANYWRANGGSYKGWEEGMRDYYKTFGTFYGYRPDWKTAGRNIPSGGNRYYSRKTYNYNNNNNNNGGGGSANYGTGSTPNNGLYWNANTSWSI